MSSLNGKIIHVEGAKLEAVIRQFADETAGPCLSTGACIGMVGKKQVQLLIVADEDEFISGGEEWRCVTVTEKLKSKRG